MIDENLTQRTQRERGNLMYRKCTTEVSVQNQKRITDSLLDLMLKMSFEDISVTALCEASGVSRRIFYHLFNNKMDALHAMIDHTILKLEGYRTDISDEMFRYFQYWYDHKLLFDALHRNHMRSLLVERLVDLVMNEDYDIQYWMKIHGWEDKEALIFHLSGTMGLVYNWYDSGFAKSPEEMAELLSRIVTKMLK